MSISAASSSLELLVEVLLHFSVSETLKVASEEANPFVCAASKLLFIATEAIPIQNAHNALHRIANASAMLLCNAHRQRNCFVP